MDKCRICSVNRRKLRSIFITDNGLSYVDMINSIANVKVPTNEETDDKICGTCQQRLKDAYEFKCLIEESELVLQSIMGYQKRINFNNVDDIKIKIEIDVNEIDNRDNKENVTKYKNINTCFENGDDSVSYNNTIIKKVSSDKETSPIDVLDFLNTIKEDDKDYDEDYNYEDDLRQEDDLRNDDENEDYDDYKPYTTNKKKKKKAKKAQKKDTATKPIKPIYLNDLKLASTKPKIIKRKRKYNDDGLTPYQKYMKRLDMCPHCGKMTRSIKSHLLLHTGERKHKCTECPKAFFTIGGLNTHQKRHAVKSYKCDKCVAVFSCSSGLRSHMLSHNDEKKYICEICSKAFKRKGALKRHVVIHNSACKSVKCELCNMTFFSKYGLRHHMRVHTGERPYKCELCNQPYSYKHDFNRHCLKKHGVFFKRRSVNIMNEEVLIRERALMKDLMLKAHGFVNGDKPLNPFEGPQAALAFEQTIKALQSKQIPIALDPPLTVYTK